MMSVSLAACGPKEESTGGTATAGTDTTTAKESEEDVTAGGTYTAGTYTATAKGNNGDVTLEVTFDSDAIKSIEIKEHGETPGISDAPIAKIPESIIANQSLNIDAITGATNTSNAILNAVADAVNQAGGDAEALKKVEVAANEAARENAALAQTDGIFYMVCDKNNAGVGEDGITYGGQNIQDLIDAGLVVKADTLEELAELIDVDPATFVETIEKFNEAVKTGVDPEFNRASFGGDFINPDGNPGIFEAPFYAGARTPSAHITKGGLKVNTSAEVIGTDGNAIPGLYAAGEVTGGRTVAGLLEAMTSGRTAGKTVMGK